MKITKSQLKQIIKEELQSFMEQEASDPDALYNAIVLNIKWIKRDGWNHKNIRSDLKGAFSSLLTNVVSHWSGPILKGFPKEALEAIKKARGLLNDIRDRAMNEDTSKGVQDINLVVPEDKTPAALANTSLGKKLGLPSLMQGASPFAPDDDDDDL